MSWNVQALNFFPYRGNVSTAVLGIARQTIPTGAILGTGIGTFVGLMILLARRRPQLVGWLVVGLLLSCVVGFVHVVAFDRVVDFVVKTRMEGVNSLMVSWTIRSEIASAIGATAGAFVGAVVVYGAVRLSEGSRALSGQRIARLVPALPFDIAADAGPLVVTHGLTQRARRRGPPAGPCR